MLHLAHPGYTGLNASLFPNKSAESYRKCKNNNTKLPMYRETLWGLHKSTLEQFNLGVPC